MQDIQQTISKNNKHRKGFTYAVSWKVLLKRKIENKLEDLFEDHIV